MTLFGIDADRLLGVNSSHPIFDVYGKDILNSGDEIQTGGYQSDICNIQTTGYLGAIGTVRGINCGEVLDCFGDGNLIHVVAQNAYEYGVKLIHGASDNLIFATVNGYRRSGFVMGGDDFTKPVSNNRVHLTAVGTIIPKTDFTASVTNGSPTLTVTAIGSGLELEVGDVIHEGRFPGGTYIQALGTGTGGVGTYTMSANATSTAAGVSMQTSPALTAAAATDGSSATYKPINNYVEVSYVGDGTHLDYGVLEVAGSDNTWKLRGSGHRIASSARDSGAPSGDNRSQFINEKRAYVTAVANAQVIATGAFAAIQYANSEVDRTGEYDNTTYTYTADGEKTLVVVARLRHGGAVDGKEYNLQVRKGGSEVFRKQQIAAGNGDFSMDTGPVLLRLSDGDTVDVRLSHNEAGNITLSNTEAFSSLYIWEVG